jgi:intracellular multiplication protein IcmV
MFKWLGRRTKKLANSASRKAAVPMMHRMYLFIKDLYAAIFKQEKGPVETFEQAMARYQLTEDDLRERKKMFQIQLLIYTLGSILMAVYTFYLVKEGYWMSMTFSLALLIYLIVSALKSHFWIFQIKQRKLGCTLQEWLNASTREPN